MSARTIPTEEGLHNRGLQIRFLPGLFKPPYSGRLFPWPAGSTLPLAWLGRSPTDSCRAY